MGMPFRGGKLDMFTSKVIMSPKLEATDMAYRPKEQSEYGRQKVQAILGGRVLRPLHFSK
jgi:hypothetical protein